MESLHRPENRAVVEQALERAFGRRMMLGGQVQGGSSEPRRAERAAARVQATAGGGAVGTVANGHGELQSLTISPPAVDPNDLILLQDLVVAAVNEVQRNARALAEERMKAVTGGLQIPGLTV